MSPLRLAVSLATLLLTTVSACSTPPAPPRTLQAYSGQAELDAALERWRQAYERLPRPLLGQRRFSPTGPQAAQSPAATGMPSAQSEMAKSAAPAVAVAPGAHAAADSITNVQTAGVDEGGIVKHAGDHLIILRRGRLFTVKVGGDDLQPVATIDAYAPGADPRGAWYDELLIHGQTVVVVGYSYARGGTEIGLFDLGRNGSLAYRATYHLRSNDYYSSRNYASRLIGSQLVFYTPLVLRASQTQHAASWWPAVRRWHAAVPEEFQRILPATRIYRSDDEFDPSQALALHTITRCELAAAPLRCESSAVLGPAGRVFYVSQGSVYVWTATRRPWVLPVPVQGAAPEELPAPNPVTVAPRALSAQSLATLFRLPLDGSAPSGIKAVGMPIDQMSFLEDGAVLSVLLRDEGSGEGMWGAERGTARMALLRLPLSALGDGHTAAAREHYRRVPGGAAWPLQNRHIGDWLVWSGGEQAWALRPALREEPTSLAPGHRVERIEAMGRDAVLVGGAGSDLRFSSLRLDRQAALAGSFSRPGARQSEARTHGFFYRPLAADEGLLGLPIVGQADGARLPHGDAHGGASVVFLRQRQLQFKGLGELAASPREAPPADGCKASCVDWYGNARPIFLSQRVFALMGYELVEGQLRGDGLGERRRLDFSPVVSPGRDGRPSPFQ